jgi:membrane protein involved in colicin uptake
MGFAVVLISLLVLSGCGGDDSSLSQDEYEQKLEVVCNEGLQEREELANKITREYEEQKEQKLTAEYQAENIRKLVTVYQGTIEEIKDLGLPEQNREKVEELIKAQEEASAKVLASPLSARDSLQTVFEEADDKAEALGVDSCTL